MGENNLPRITIEVTEDFKQKVRLKAVQENTTVTHIVYNLLKKWLNNDKSGS